MRQTDNNPNISTVVFIRLVQIGLIVFSLYSVQNFFVSMSGSLDFAMNRPASEGEQKRTLLKELPRIFAATNPNRMIEEAMDAEDFALAGIYINYSQKMPYWARSDVSIRPDLVERYEKSQTWLAKAGRLGSQCAEGVLIRSAETAAQFTCQMLSNLSLFGDAADLAKEGYDWANDGEVDEVIVGLSLVGLGASAVPILYPAAGGAGIGKVIIKGGAKTFPVAKPLRMAVKNAVDFPALKTELSSYRSWRAIKRGYKNFDYKKYVRPKETESLVRGMGDLATLSTSVEPTVAIRTLKRVDNFDELAKMTKVINVAGPDASKIIGIMGKTAPKILRTARPAIAYAKYTYKASLALWGVATAALVAFFEFGLRRWLWAKTVQKCRQQGISVIPKFWGGEGGKFIGISFVFIGALASGHWYLNNQWNVEKMSHQTATLAAQVMDQNTVYLEEIHKVITEKKASKDWYQENQLDLVCDVRSSPTKFSNALLVQQPLSASAAFANSHERAATCSHLIDEFFLKWPLKT